MKKGKCNPGIKNYELKEAYETSFLLELYRGVSPSKNTVSAFLNDLGSSIECITPKQAAGLYYFYRRIYVILVFLYHRRYKILNRFAQPWVMNDKVDCRRVAFRHHSPLTLMNKYLQITKDLR